VRAYHGTSYTSYTPVQFIRLFCVPPPPNLTALSSGQFIVYYVTVTWNDDGNATQPEDESETGFEIWRTTVSSSSSCPTPTTSSYSRVGTTGTQGDPSTFSDYPVSHGTTYCYSVRASRSTDNTYSAFSNTMKITP
jgi:hypothetical protein